MVLGTHVGSAVLAAGLGPSNKVRCTGLVDGGGRHSHDGKAGGNSKRNGELHLRMDLVLRLVR